MQNREDSCFFSAAHAAKDSGIALELARNLSLDLPLARTTKEQYDRMIAEDLGDLANPASPSLRSKTAINIPAIACDSFGTVEPSGPAKPKAKKGRILLQSLSIRIGQANLPEPVLLVLHEPLRSERTVGLANQPAFPGERSNSLRRLLNFPRPSTQPLRPRRCRNGRRSGTPAIFFVASL